MKTVKILKVLVVLMLWTLFISCSKADRLSGLSSEKVVLEETGETPELNSYSSEIEAYNPVKKEAKIFNVKENAKIIKNANCRLKVKKVENATSRAKQFARLHNGYISDERFTQTNYSKENRFVIRIPGDRFDLVLDSICNWVEFVDHKNITTLDVTEEYTDVSSRLKTKLEVKERYESILRTKAKSVEDVLNAEGKINEIQEEIEAAKGRLRYLSNKVSYSTIQVDMYERVAPQKEPEPYKPSFFKQAKKGFVFGWVMIEKLMLLLFYVWPVLVVVGVIFAYFKWVKK